MVRGIVVSMIVFLTGTMIMAEEFTSVQSGNWGNKQAWGGDKIPDVQDEVTIEHTVTGNGQCRCRYSGYAGKQGWPRMD